MLLLWRRSTKTFFVLLSVMFLGMLCLSMQAQAADYFTRHQIYATLNCQQLQSNGSKGNCIDTLLELANLELNQRYDQLMTVYQSPTTANTNARTDAVDQQLLQAQQQWLQFRTQHCAFEAQASTANAAKTTQSSNQIKLCELALTRERIEYLGWFLGR